MTNTLLRSIRSAWTAKQPCVVQTRHSALLMEVFVNIGSRITGIFFVGCSYSTATVALVSVSAATFDSTDEAWTEVIANPSAASINLFILL